MRPAPAAAPPEVLDLEPLGSPTATLLDAVDRLIDKGTLLSGDLVISVAGVDLIALNLRLMLAGVETLARSAERRGGPAGTGGAGEVARGSGSDSPATGHGGAGTVGGSGAAAPFRVEAVEPGPGQRASREPAPVDAPARVAVDAKQAGKGVAKLVLTLVEFIRRLLERQAIRRMEGGRLPDADVERMGESLARLEAKVLEMKRAFGLEGEDLDIDLGPLGRLSGPAGEAR